jgi:PilZ domain
MFQVLRFSPPDRLLVFRNFPPQSFDLSWPRVRFSPYPFRNQKQNSKTALFLRRNFMPANERRIVHRKPCTLPIRFTVLSEKFAIAGDIQADSGVLASADLPEARAFVPHAGETVNLSERGVAFKSRHSMRLGQTIELFFTLPTELTGRMPENVRCIARVVHVDRFSDPQGSLRVGADIERFERVASTPGWDN